MKVLLIDDSRVMRRMLQRTLEELLGEEAEFFEASDGAKGVQELERIACEVDVVFCDLCMPELDGIGFIQELRERGWLEACPVVVLSGDVRVERGTEALAAGATQVIEKPFTPEEIQEALTVALEGSR